MSKSDFFVDFHCHATLRAMNSQPVSKSKNLWEKTVNPSIDTPIGRWAKMQTREIWKESQTNLYDYSASKTRIIFDALYPVEKGWYQFRKVPSFLVGQKAKEDLMLVAFGIEYDRMCALKTSDGYFGELKESYEFLVNGQGLAPDGKSVYQVAKNYQHIEQILKSDPHSIAVVVNVEGAHALECGAPCTLNINPVQHKELLAQNLMELKSWEYPIFYMNMAHHFYNQLCGHARSLKSPISIMFNQDIGMNEGITDLGWFVVENLLNNKNGRRILIDTKHMSLKSRQDYYRFIQLHNKNFPQEKIPVICSHGGVNGFETMEESGSKPDVMKKFKGEYFNTWSINLSEEEINIIHDSGGLIGLMMDKTLLGSPETLKAISSMQVLQERKHAFLKLFLDNLFGIIKAVGKKSAWEIPTLGSDYDGIITHIDFYPDAASLEDFREDLLAFLELYEYQHKYWHGYTPKEIIKKVFQTNSLNFLRKHF